MARSRWVAAFAALLVFSAAGVADAKKKHTKKRSTPAGKSSGKAAPAEPEEGTGGQGEEEEKPASPKSSAEPAGEAHPAGEAAEGSSSGKASRPKRGGEAEPADEGAFALPALDIVVAGGARFRQLGWSQNVTSSFAPYTLAPGPEIRLGFEVYPAAFTMTGFAANLGLFGGFNYGINTTSKVQTTGMKLTTKFQDFTVGVKIRVPFDKVVPYASVAYATQNFELDGQMPLTVPGVDYKLVRVGLGTRIWLTSTVDLDVGAAFLYVLGLGDSSADVASPPVLPNATAYGIDGNLSLGFRLSGLFGLRAGADFRQYGISGNSRATDPVRAGGATDRFVVAWAGVELAFDGVAGGEGRAESPPASKTKRRSEPEPSESEQE